MAVRFVVIAATLLTSTGALAAEQGGSPTRANAPQQRSSAQVVLASAADTHSSPSTDQPATAAPKPARVARVTTCRCGGQEAVDPEEQQQP